MQKHTPTEKKPHEHFTMFMRLLTKLQLIIYLDIIV